MVSGSDRVKTYATASHPIPIRYTSRHDVSEMPASGIAPTADPAPTPLPTARMLSAHARVFVPISSVANTNTKTVSEIPSGRPTVCVATNTANDGANAPSEITNGASQARLMMILRRPIRSASAASGMAMTTPQRTMAAAKPWPCSEMLNSLDA